MYTDDRREIKNEYIDEALFAVENILTAISNGNYEEIENYVDKHPWDNIEELENIISMKLKDAMGEDEYNDSCDFDSTVEPAQCSFYTNDDNSGFTLDYDITADGEFMDLVLHLEFIYNENGLIRRFIGIDA